MATFSSRDVSCKNGTFVVIRCAASADAKGLIKFAHQVLSDGEGQIRLPEEFSKKEKEQQDWIRKHREHPDWLLLVAETDGAIVGCLDFSSGSHTRLAHRGVFGMAVEPGWRSIGVGQGLLSVFIEWAQKNPNLEKLCLAVISTNSRAIALYEKMGFQEEGRRVREVKLGNNNYVDDILMYRFVE